MSLLTCFWRQQKKENEFVFIFFSHSLPCSFFLYFSPHPLSISLFRFISRSFITWYQCLGFKIKKITVDCNFFEECDYHYLFGFRTWRYKVVNLLYTWLNFYLFIFSFLITFWKIYNLDIFLKKKFSSLSSSSSSTDLRFWSFTKIAKASCHSLPLSSSFLLALLYFL